MGVVVIPKSANPERIAENSKVTKVKYINLMFEKIIFIILL